MVTVGNLILWATEQVGTCDPQVVCDKLSCEGLPWKEVPRGADKAVRAFRRLNMKARLQKIRSTLKDVMTDHDDPIDNRVYDQTASMTITIAFVRALYYWYTGEKVTASMDEISLGLTRFCRKFR